MKPSLNKRSQKKINNDNGFTPLDNNLTGRTSKG